MRCYRPTKTGWHFIFNKTVSQLFIILNKMNLTKSINYKSTINQINTPSWMCLTWTKIHWLNFQENCIPKPEYQNLTSIFMYWAALSEKQK